jgi:hypothetical protein
MDVVWNSMGFMRWPLAFSLLCVVLLSAYSFGRLYRPSATADLLTKTWLDAILFWGGFAMIAGVLGTLVGVVIAAQAIEAAGAVSPSLVWGGIKVGLRNPHSGGVGAALVRPPAPLAAPGSARGRRGVARCARDSRHGETGRLEKTAERTYKGV